jgi:RND family efflux transporter MFP subunit
MCRRTPPSGVPARCESDLSVILIAVFCAVLPLGSGCDRPAPAAAQQQVPKVTVTAVVSQETVDADEYTGQTEASESVEVRARVFGYLQSIEFKDGDLVTGPEVGPNGEVLKEGQTLFTIEPDEYQAIHQQSVSRIDLNQANLELAQAKLARNTKLVQSGAVSKEEYEESVAAVKSAEATITAAKADANRTAVDLKYTVIRAPISGRIDRAIVSKGNLLTGGQSSGTLLTKIVQEQPMHVYFDVDERSLLRYMRQRRGSLQSAPGSLRDLELKCYLQLADEKDFSHEGTLDFASSELNKSTGTARIRGVFPNKNRLLASGLFVRVRIPLTLPYQALMIPERALATDQSIKFVYVVGSDGLASRRSVELGAQRGDMRIVTSGLQAGEQVIVKGLQRVRPGQKVEPEVEKTGSPTTTVHKPVAPMPANLPQPKAAPSDNPPPGAKQER